MADTASQPGRAEAVDISVVVCTYNGGAGLRALMDSVLGQETGGAFTYELLVVDNNSRDQTPVIAEEYARSHPGVVRVSREAQQGKSYALNTGVRLARGEYCFILDQDERLVDGYLRELHRTLRGHPDAAFVGGRVLPERGIELPAWLSRDHWSAIAMCDYGGQGFYTDAQRNLCLLAGTFRKTDVEAVGGYIAALGIRPGWIGSVEDADLYSRLYRSGRKGYYTPGLELRHDIDAGRLEKAYHRRWHFGHGRYFSLMREPDFERSSRRILDLPCHVFRQGAASLTGWLAATLAGRTADAFTHELRVRFFAGYVYQRVCRPSEGAVS